MYRSTHSIVGYRLFIWVQTFYLGIQTFYLGIQVFYLGKQTSYLGIDFLFDHFPDYHLVLSAQQHIIISVGTRLHYYMHTAG